MHCEPIQESLGTKAMQHHYQQSVYQVSLPGMTKTSVLNSLEQEITLIFMWDS